MLESKPLVDQFGQWMGDDWPGKATSLEQFTVRLGRRGQSAREGRSSSYCPLWRLRGLESQSHRLLPRGEDRRQVVVYRSRRPPVPLAGSRFHGDCSRNFHPGARAVVRRAAARGPPRRSVAAVAPEHPSTPGTWCAASARTGARKWVDLTARRMFAWGFNTVGNWSDTAPGQRAPRAPRCHAAWVGNPRPDRWASPMFMLRSTPRTIDQAAARQVRRSHKDDPYVLGYFLGNEPPWPGRESRRGGCRFSRGRRAP